MSHSKSENLVAAFSGTGNILQSYDGTRIALDINEVRRFSPEVFVKYLYSLLGQYIDKFLKELNLCIDYKYTFNKNPEEASPLEVSLFVDTVELNISVIEELRSVASYALSLTQDCSDLFDTADDAIQLSNEKAEFVVELANVFLKKHGGKNITKPFECKVGGQNRSFTPFQGRIRLSYISNEIDESDFIMHAKLDGFKSSEMLIYLQEIDSELKLIPASVPYKVVKPSLIKTAAEVYVNLTPAYVTVTAFKKADEKGKVCLYVRDLNYYESDELTELIASN